MDRSKWNSVLIFMRILFIHKAYFPALKEGGDTLILYQIASELVRQGHDVTIYATNANAEDDLPEKYKGRVQIEGVNIYYFPRVSGGIFRARYYSKNMMEYLSLHAAEFDVAHIWHIFTYIPYNAAKILRKIGIPYVVSPHANFSPFSFKKNRLLKSLYLKYFERKTLLLSNGIQTNTNYDRQWAIDKGVPESLMLPVISYGIRVTPCESLEELGCADPFFLFIGRVDRIKGLDFFLRSFSKWVAGNGIRVKVIVAGPFSGNYEAEFTNLVQSLYLEDYVEVIGLVDEPKKQALLKNCLALVLPSYTESFGLTVVEAMALGAPVLISNECNVKDHVIAAGAGFVLEHDEDRWVLGLKTLYNNRELRYELGVNGKKYYLKNLTTRRCATGFLSNYKLVAKINN